jgi:hypothetical protein
MAARSLRSLMPNLMYCVASNELIAVQSIREIAARGGVATDPASARCAVL